MFTSCQYKFNIEPTTPPPDPEETIYFSQDVLPIWNNNENCTSCHKSGGPSPDLTTENAYNEIMGGYVNTDTPENSSIYTATHPDTDSHDWKKYSDSEAAIVLQWIEQGTLNN
jgi:hypothetical protein